MTKYTFTFPYDEERVFKEVVSRLDPDEFVVIEDIRPVEAREHEDPRYVDRQTIMEMEPEAASTFRFRMGNSIKIRRERTEEELAEEKEINDRNTIKVTVHVPMGDPTAGKP
jgi:hypothetical protein